MFLRFGQLDLRRPDLDSIPRHFRESRVGRSLWGIQGIEGGHGVGALEISFDGSSWLTSSCLWSTCIHKL